MIINTTPANIATMGGVSAVSEFKIRNSAKAFGILSDGLYANKIRAILRELGCNAVDSHVAAGKGDVPFDVHLPTTLQPYFSVRDYGTGLSHEEVIDVYTTYFESTKTESNDFIGALGLGSKSPFSYTENFTVTAIKDGRKGIYSAFINDQGVPTVATMGQSATDEPSGVEVRFAVTDEHDCDRFASEAKTVFSYFEVLPTFTSASVEVTRPEYDEDLKQYGIYQRKSRTTYAGGLNRAIMGNIAYVIDNANVNTDAYRPLRGEGIDLYFDIGEIDFQASREGLQYTSRTVDAINKKCTKIDEELYPSFEKMANDIENAWERYKFIDKHERTLYRNVLTKYLEETKQPFHGFNFDGFPMDAEYVREKFNIDIRMMKGYGSWGKDQTMAKECTELVGTRHLRPGSIRFVKNPDSAKIINRTKNHMRNNGIRGMVYILFPGEPDDPAEFPKTPDFDGFFEYIHNPPEQYFINIDDLDVIERNNTVRSKRDIMRMTYDSSSSARYAREKYKWDNNGYTIESLKDIDQKVYVELNGYDAFCEDSPSPIDLKDLMHGMSNAGTGLGLVQEIYGVRKSALDAVKKDTSWISIKEYINEVFSNVSEYTINQAAMKSYLGKLYYAYHAYVIGRFNADLSSGHALTELFASLGSVSDSRGPSIDLTCIGRLCKTMGIDDTLKVKCDQKESEIRQIFDQYPMLLLVGDNWLSRFNMGDDAGVNKTIDKMVEYIKIVDEHKGV